MSAGPGLPKYKIYTNYRVGLERFFLSLECSHDAINMIFGILGTFWVYIEIINKTFKHFNFSEIPREIVFSKFIRRKNIE